MQTATARERARAAARRRTVMGLLVVMMGLILGEGPRLCELQRRLPTPQVFPHLGVAATEFPDLSEWTVAGYDGGEVQLLQPSRKEMSTSTGTQARVDTSPASRARFSAVRKRRA